MLYKKLCDKGRLLFLRFTISFIKESHWNSRQAIKKVPAAKAKSTAF